MKWKAEYATGVPEVDAHHQSLFSYSDEFRDVIEHGFGETNYEMFLEFLVMYVDVHFDFEEKCMLAHRCPFAKQDRREHVSFRRMVEEEQLAYRDNGFDHQRVVNLLDAIDRWLVSHICQVDVKLKDYVS